MIDVDRKSDPYPPTMGEMARAILESRAAGEPVSLSINGRGNLAVGDEASILELFELVDRLETIAVLNERIGRVERGEKGLSLEEVRAELNRRYGYPV